MTALVLGYFIGINMALFLVMKIDKNRAKQNQYRISEKTLWILALAGGAIGGTVGMRLFRHKTKHTGFMVGFPFVAIVNIIFLVILLSSIQS